MRRRMPNTLRVATGKRDRYSLEIKKYLSAVLFFSPVILRSQEKYFGLAIICCVYFCGGVIEAEKVVVNGSSRLAKMLYYLLPYNFNDYVGGGVHNRHCRWSSWQVFNFYKKIFVPSSLLKKPATSRENVPHSPLVEILREFNCIFGQE